MIITEKYNDEKQIIRRKAKRIERANNLMHQLLYDYKPYIDGNIKDSFEEDVKLILKYLKNDDKEENRFNEDNFNG